MKTDEEEFSDLEDILLRVVQDYNELAVKRGYKCRVALAVSEDKEMSLGEEATALPQWGLAYVDADNGGPGVDFWFNKMTFKPRSEGE